MSEELQKSEQEIVVGKGVSEADADSIRISTEVIGIVAGIAAGEVPGLAGMSGGIVGGIAEKLGRRDLARGIKVYQDEDKVRLDINIIVEYGLKITDVAMKLKDLVREAVENITGLKVVAINVHVQGIHLSKEGEDKQARE